MEEDGSGALPLILARGVTSSQGASTAITALHAHLMPAHSIKIPITMYFLVLQYNLLPVKKTYILCW